MMVKERETNDENFMSDANRIANRLLMGNKNGQENENVSEVEQEMAENMHGKKFNLGSQCFNIGSFRSETTD